MRRHALALGLLLGLLAPSTAVAAVWLTTAAKASQEITDHYQDVSLTRCYALPKADQAVYGATSEVFPNGDREWNAFLCGLVFQNGSICWGIYHTSGQLPGQFRLGTAPSRGCTPYELHRILTSATTTE
jgi:hypothetical protein